jgi:hypothetical protein
MNLREKQEAKDKLETLAELLSMVDSSFIFEHSTEDLNRIANLLTADMQAHFCQGDNRLALNLLLRCCKKAVTQLKADLSTE